jgi:hypothetical protein
LTRKFDYPPKGRFDAKNPHHHQPSSPSKIDKVSSKQQETREQNG